MSNPGDKRSQEPPATAAETPAGDSSAEAKRSGRISYDERGNSVWEWQLETGVYSRDITTQRLKKLDLDELSIADTAIHQWPPGLGDPADRKTQPGGGFNPYDNSSTARGNVASAKSKVSSDPYNSGGGAPLKSHPKRKPTDLKKLQEWIELRKRVEQNKRESGDD